MGTPAYKYEKGNLKSYSFTSKGCKGAIAKIVEFTPTSQKGIFNLAFGDLLLDGSIDDESNSNNGDMIKVLSTVIEIVKDFTKDSTGLKIVFAGSTIQRTRLYHRILKNYRQLFEKEFVLTVLVEVGNKKYLELPFSELEEKSRYIGFFKKRK